MSLIKKYNLSDNEVRKIVLEWYLLGYEPEIFVSDSSHCTIEIDEYINDTYEVYLDDEL